MRFPDWRRSRVERTPLLVLALTLLSPGCSPEPPPAIELTLHDRPVDCQEGPGPCRDGEGIDPGERHQARTVLRSTRTALSFKSRFRRPGGAYAELELMVPLGGPAAPRVTYRERLRPGGPATFEADQASGRIELSRSGCPCQTGRLELLLRDTGPDGQLQTADDAVRRISQARLRRDGRPFCHGRAVLPIKDGLLVVGTRPCPRTAARRGGGGGSACAWDGAGWVSTGWNEEGWYDEGWNGDWDAESAWGADEWESGCTTDCWSDDGWEDDGWEDDGWSEDGWDDDGWGDEDGDDWWNDDGGGDTSGDDWWSSGDDWGDDGWSDDDSSDDDDWWDSDDGWGDDGWGDDSGGDDGSDDDWW